MSICPPTPPTGVAVQLGEQHTVDTQRFVKGGGGIHRILTGHGVHHQQDLRGLHRRLDGLQLVHQGLVDVQPSCGIQKDHIVAVEGTLGTETFRRIVNHPALRRLPMLLETPNELPGYAAEIALLRGFEEAE